MSEKNLTDLKYWEKYWDNNLNNKEDFGPFYAEFNHNDFKAEQSILEVGGYIGSRVAWLAETYKMKPAILDIVMHDEVVRRVEEQYNLAPNTIKTYKQDFLKNDISEKFEYVTSYGFIEHFENLEEIIDGHLLFCKDGGSVFITVPNLNGGFYELVTRIFNREAFNFHNLRCMSLDFFHNYAKSRNLEYEVYYSGLPGNYWLPVEKEGKISRFILTTIKMIIRKLANNRKNKYVSPQIIFKVIDYKQNKS